MPYILPTFRFLYMRCFARKSARFPTVIGALRVPRGVLFLGPLSLEDSLPHPLHSCRDSAASPWYVRYHALHLGPGLWRFFRRHRLPTPRHSKVSTLRFLQSLAGWCLQAGAGPLFWGASGASLPRHSPAKGASSYPFAPATHLFCPATVRVCPATPPPHPLLPRHELAPLGLARKLALAK